MNKNKKIKAFSMLEIMVAIIISGIVIATAYSVFMYTNSMFIKFSGAKKEVKTYFELSSILFREVERSNYIEKENDRELNVVIENQKIRYTFNDEYVVRVNQEHADTFRMKVANIELTTLNKMHEKWVDQIHLSIDNKGKEEELSFIKNYGAVSKIQPIE